MGTGHGNLNEMRSGSVHDVRRASVTMVGLEEKAAGATAEPFHKRGRKRMKRREESKASLDEADEVEEEEVVENANVVAPPMMSSMVLASMNMAGAPLDTLSDENEEKKEEGAKKEEEEDQ